MRRRGPAEAGSENYSLSGTGNDGDAAVEAEGGRHVVEWVMGWWGGGWVSSWVGE